MVEKEHNMIDFTSREELPGHLIDRSPRDYFLTPEDVAWLAGCAAFVKGALSPASALQAVQESVKQHGDALHVDPFELLIDAGILIHR